MGRLAYSSSTVNLRYGITMETTKAIIEWNYKETNNE